MLRKNLAILSLLSLTLVTASIFTMDSSDATKIADRKTVDDLIKKSRNLNIHDKNTRENLFQ